MGTRFIRYNAGQRKRSPAKLGNATRSKSLAGLRRGKRQETLEARAFPTKLGNAIRSKPLAGLRRGKRQEIAEARAFPTKLGNAKNFDASLYILFLGLDK